MSCLYDRHNLHDDHHGDQDRQDTQGTQDRQNRQIWHLNLIFQLTCVGQLSQFLRCFVNGSLYSPLCLVWTERVFDDVLLFQFWFVALMLSNTVPQPLFDRVVSNETTYFQKWETKPSPLIFSVTKIFFSDSKSMLAHLFQICFCDRKIVLAHIFQSRVLNAISLSAFWLNTAFKAVPFHHHQSTTISWLEHTSEIQAKVCFTFWSHSL